MRLAVDTHILVRWLTGTGRLSREQARVIEAAERRGEPVGLSAFTLFEIAMLVTDGRLQLNAGLDEFMESIEVNPAFRILPLSPMIAVQAAGLHVLKDSGDRIISATARVHGLRLVTSDARIIESNVVSTVS